MTILQLILESLIGTQVRFEQPGDIGLAGRLVNVQEDYATIYTDTGQMIHYPYDHVKSVTANMTEVPETVPLSVLDFPCTFYELLSTFRKRMIKIENGEGTRTGVLTDVTEDHVCIVLNMNERIFYPLNQILNISPLLAIQQKKQNEKQEDSSSTALQEITLAPATEETSTASGEPHRVTLLTNVARSGKTEKSRRSLFSGTRELNHPSLKRTPADTFGASAEENERIIPLPVKEPVKLSSSESPSSAHATPSGQSPVKRSKSAEEKTHAFPGTATVIQEEEERDIRETNRGFTSADRKFVRTKPILILKNLKYRGSSTVFPARLPEDDKPSSSSPPLLPSPESKSASFPSLFQVNPRSRSRQKAKKRARSISFPSSFSPDRALGS
jgi:hypothetical protein